MATKNIAKIAKTKKSPTPAANGTPKASRSLAVRLHVEEIAIVKEAAAQAGKNAGAFMRLAAVAAACADMGTDNPGLPEFAAGRVGGVKAAATALGLSAIEFRKRAVAKAITEGL